MHRLVGGVRRSGSALVLELGPLARDELAALLAAQSDAPAAVTDAIIARSEGNPFFAEELLAAAGVRSGIEWARPRAQIRVWLCAKGLRAQAELAALARARHDAKALGDALARARAARRSSARGGRGRADHPERRRLARPQRGRARARTARA